MSMVDAQTVPRTATDAAPAQDPSVASVTPARRSRGGTWRLLASELGLTFRRPRNLAMLAVLACVPVLIGVVLRMIGAEGADDAMISMVAGNGLVLTFASLFVLVPLLLPLAVAVVAGDAIAGESAIGTLRYLLTAPVGRTRLLLVKYANAALYGLAASAVIALSALVTGLALFPAGPVTLLSGTTITMAEGLLRVLVVVAYVGAGMAALAAVALALSTLTEVPIGAIAATAVILVVVQVLAAIPQLEPVQPYLLTSWLGAFDGVLRDPMVTGEMAQGLLVFGCYIVVAGSVAWARFSGRDVTA
ncbi:ABC transporter permease [Spongiactinospora sp. TRM90649]|uniref:ABC transporter permease n=1 Tax=Spongiactinospora sp. TRM90649 TaxID=3031114 RepID=UPI0023F6C171|nr:ABC transporter permease [Spongiactinospora sp. TRM90649]MDF5753909.1 ABC transporter permease [Spongiactinospora sp. TRM90649]